NSTTSSRVRYCPTSGTQPSRLTVASLQLAGQGDPDRLDEALERAEGVVHRGGLVPAVHHAVTALVVAALLAVVLPRRGLHQLLEGAGVTLLQEIARPLPPEDVVGRVAPRRALEVVLAHEEAQEEGRLVEPPPLLGPAQHLAEQVVGARLEQEVLLVRRLRVAVAGGDHHPLDAQVHHLVEELAHPQRGGAVEERAVGGHPEAALHGLADGRHRLVVDAVPADRFVVLFPQAVHVDAEREVLRRGEEVELFLQEDGVGAEIHVLLPLHQLRDQPVDLRVHQRLAARNAHDGRAALLDRSQALLDAQVLLEDRRRVLDLAAAGAGEIAPEERLEHQNERVALAPRQLLAEDVRRDRPHLRQRNAHVRRILPALKASAARPSWPGRTVIRQTMGPPSPY